MNSAVNASQPWWLGAVFYQIYPRSFMDANGDGIGDLQGITQKLDHIANLGVDGIWISPFFTSPMKDFGYDVSDYRDVDPIFGTLEDFDALVARAHQLDLKVIIDQVYSHTSDQHAWFTESRSSRDNPKADWYVWANPKEDGSPPNNWLSNFGSSAWTWDGRRQQYYLHNFLNSQPDLNLHSAEVQQALVDVAKFWCERGVDGMRLDAINCGMHDVYLRDNPPAKRDGRVFSTPFSMQHHIYTMSHPDMIHFLELLRSTLNNYGSIFTVAEVGGEDPTPTMKLYTEGDERLCSAYGFEYLGLPEITAQHVRRILGYWPGTENEGWPSWAFSNHDAPRVNSRWGQQGDLKQRAKFHALLQMSLRGNIFLYQGEELGLTQVEIPFEDLQDPEAIANWPNTLGRDGARTPMPWQHEADYLGFSTSKTWLPVGAEHKPLAVDNQEADTDSVLNFFRSVIEFRQNCPTLRSGDLTLLESPEEIIAIERSMDDESLICVFNLGTANTRWQPNGAASLEVAMSVGCEDQSNVPSLLAPLSGYIAK